MRQSASHYDGCVISSDLPMGRTHCGFGEEPREQLETGTGRWAIEQGFAFLTPLRVDLADEQRQERALPELQDS